MTSSVDRILTFANRASCDSNNFQHWSTVATRSLKFVAAAATINTVIQNIFDEEDGGCFNKLLANQAQLTAIQIINNIILDKFRPEESLPSNSDKANKRKQKQHLPNIPLNVTLHGCFCSISSILGMISAYNCAKQTLDIASAEALYQQQQGHSLAYSIFKTIRHSIPSTCMSLTRFSLASAVTYLGIAPFRKYFQIAESYR